MKIILLCLLSFGALAQVKNLEFQKIYFGYDTLEISGLVIKDSIPIVVADDADNQSLYQIQLDEKEARYKYTKLIDVSKLQGYTSYYAKNIFSKQGERLLKAPIDFEGICFCGNTFYIANEQTRHVLKITGKKVENLPIDFVPIFDKNKTPLAKISTNAGFEGIAVDCKNDVLYIAQERSPRAIIKIDLKTNTPLEIFNTPIVKETPGINEDYADIFYENEYLYLLERNSHIITKISVKTQKVIESYSFFNLDRDFSTNELYNTGEPFGIAEALFLTPTHIVIGLDNNDKPLSKKAEEKYKLKGSYSAILFFKRPKGF